MAVEESSEVRARVHDQLARVYSIIGSLILEVPTAELFLSIDAELASACEGIGSFCPKAGEEVSHLRESMSQPLGDIRTDYAGLFAGVKKLPAPPWESCYLSGKRQVCTEITENVRLAYLEACLCQEPSEAQPDDHIGLELQFLGAMSRRIADAIEAGDSALAEVTSAQRSDFVSEHLSKWALAFSDDLERAAATGFYRSLAQLTASLIKCEMEGMRKCLD